MDAARTYLSGLTLVHRIVDDDERRQIWRQGMAALAARRTSVSMVAAGLCHAVPAATVIMTTSVMLTAIRS